MYLSGVRSCCVGCCAPDLSSAPPTLEQKQEGVCVWPASRRAPLYKSDEPEGRRQGARSGASLAGPQRRARQRFKSGGTNTTAKPGRMWSGNKLATSRHTAYGRRPVSGPQKCLAQYVARIDTNVIKMTTLVWLLWLFARVQNMLIGWAAGQLEAAAPQCPPSNQPKTFKSGATT